MTTSIPLHEKSGRWYYGTLLRPWQGGNALFLCMISSPGSGNKKRVARGRNIWYTACDEFPHLVQARSDRAVVSSADGPKRGQETEGLKSKPVSSPSRREAARCEQARRDKTKRSSTREQDDRLRSADRKPRDGESRSGFRCSRRSYRPSRRVRDVTTSAPKCTSKARERKRIYGRNRKNHRAHSGGCPA